MTQEPGKWSVVLVRHDNEGEPFVCHYVNDGHYWWSVSSDGVGYSWEQLVAEDAHLQVIQTGSETCMAFECGKPQATFGPCQEHLDESIAEEERRFASVEAVVDRVKALWDAWENGLVADESLGSELRVVLALRESQGIGGPQVRELENHRCQWYHAARENGYEADSARTGFREMEAEAARLQAKVERMRPFADLGYEAFAQGWRDRLADTEEMLRRVVLDSGAASCDDLHHCNCSMARAYRFALTAFEGGENAPFSGGASGAQTGADRLGRAGQLDPARSDEIAREAVERFDLTSLHPRSKCKDVRFGDPTKGEG